MYQIHILINDISYQSIINLLNKQVKSGFSRMLFRGLGSFADNNEKMFYSMVNGAGGKVIQNSLQDYLTENGYHINITSPLEVSKKGEQFVLSLLFEVTDYSGLAAKLYSQCLPDFLMAWEDKWSEKRALAMNNIFATLPESCIEDLILDVASEYQRPILNLLNRSLQENGVEADLASFSLEKI